MAVVSAASGIAARLVPDVLELQSATGVELRLAIAGAGARAYAYLLDWHIRAVFFVSWYVLAALSYNRSWSVSAPLDPDSTWFGLVVAPAAALYFLYHFVLELLMRGRTPGKRLAGVRLVDHRGSTPGAGAVMTRNVFRLIDSFPVFYGVGLMAVMLTPRRARLGDLAAGTLLVYERERAELLEHVGDTAFATPLGPREVEVLNELLRRWSRLAPEARGRLARALLTRAGAAPTDASASDDALQLALRGLAGRAAA